METISWVAVCLSIIGITLNAYKNVWCWPIWCLSNLCWIYYTYKTKQTSQLILWIVYTGFNVFACYNWLK
jgi:hypothetical protein